MHEIIKIIEELQKIKYTLEIEPSGPMGDKLRDYVDGLIAGYQEEFDRYEKDMYEEYLKDQEKKRVH
tara:strand:- start:8 stop:208 length:201 start_codon:yes stop_codon:yes gene_type:complete